LFNLHGRFFRPPSLMPNPQGTGRFCNDQSK
jgi:hypothetical protein